MTPRDIVKQVDSVSEEDIQEALKENERERKILLKLIQTKRLTQEPKTAGVAR